MEVNKNNNVDAAHRVIINRATSRWSLPESDTSSFVRVTGFDHALRATPVVRPEVLSRAKKLIADPNYPTSAQIEGIAALLTRKLDCRMA
jgi:hypothetical protein